MFHSVKNNIMSWA